MKTNIQTNIRSLSTILDSLRTGAYQVPPFQRDFVWERKDVKELFDSISKGYPIGSILLWRPAEAPEWTENRTVGGFTLPPDNKESRCYVLDGCQRLSSLFGCLTDPVNSGLECDEVQHKDFFELYYDLKDGSFTYISGKPQAYQMPVYLLLSTRAFRKYSRDVLEKEVTNLWELDDYLNKADILSQTLADYKLTVIEINGAVLDDAVNIFSRVNSRGKEISDDWMVSAMSYSKDFNLSIEIDSVVERLEQYNFSLISRNYLFRCYQSAFDDKLYIDVDNKSLYSRDDFQPTVKAMSDAIVKAVEFLYNQLRVIDKRLLPYTAQLVYLSVFFMRVASPTEKQCCDLKTWFWKTSYSNFFTASSLSEQRQAFEHFIQYIAGTEESPLQSFASESRVMTMSWPKALSLGSARSDALVLFMLNRIDVSDDKLDNAKLFMSKIRKGSDVKPENIVVSFEKVNVANLNREVYLLPNEDYDSPDFLKLRKKEIQSAEQKFVESLGLIYNS
jgi:hypothetical protein